MNIVDHHWTHTKLPAIFWGESCVNFLHPTFYCLKFPHCDPNDQTLGNLWTKSWHIITWFDVNLIFNSGSGRFSKEFVETQGVSWIFITSSWEFCRLALSLSLYTHFGHIWAGESIPNWQTGLLFAVWNIFWGHLYTYTPLGFMEGAWRHAGTGGMLTAEL